MARSPTLTTWLLWLLALAPLLAETTVVAREDVQSLEAQAALLRTQLQAAEDNTTKDPTTSVSLSIQLALALQQLNPHAPDGGRRVGVAKGGCGPHRRATRGF